MTSAPDGSIDEICVRELGGFTRKLRKKADECDAAKRPLWVRVDGPYGDIGLCFARHPVGIFIGGGVGITPIIGVLRHVYRLHDSSLELTPDNNVDSEGNFNSPDSLWSESSEAAMFAAQLDVGVMEFKEHIYVLWTVASLVSILLRRLSVSV